MDRPHHGAALGAIVACTVWCAGAGDGCRKENVDASGQAALTRSWSALPPEALERIWDAAQGTGAVIAAEPETEIVGSRAAKKKTWTLADVLLKFFVYGFQPNWFPADAIRRTACGADPRWAYFWHLASGDERDLHPWMDGAAAFAQLVGKRNHVLLSSGALDVSSCREVYADAPDGKACLYGEVTPPEGFETWFCGGRGAACYGRVKGSHTQAPPDLASPAIACVHGPWVLERAHDWRPEIHPAEVMWVRHADAQGYWTFALLPDDSGRFRKKKHFDESPEPAEWRPWSSDRPVELWVAYSLPVGPPPVFDLSVKRLDEKPRPAAQVTLKLPASGPDFVAIPHALSSVVSVVARSWTSAGGETRGLLVLRSKTYNDDRTGVVMRLRGRNESDPPWPVELLPAPAPKAALAAAPAEKPGAVRLLSLVRLTSRARGQVTANTFVRFDPASPAEPADEELADRLNEALSGSKADRIREFGTERPFRVEWTILPENLLASGYPGPATSEVVVLNRDRRSQLSDRESVVYLGSVDVVQPPAAAPPGERVVRGEGRVVYTGKPIGLASDSARVVFQWPQPTYANEWALVKAVLDEIEPATADARLASLKKEACAPAAVEACETVVLAESVSKQLADPVRRWDTLAELTSGDRPFARFVRLFSRALLWDGQVEEAEREKLKRLLAAAMAET